MQGKSYLLKLADVWKCARLWLAADFRKEPTFSARVSFSTDPVRLVIPDLYFSFEDLRDDCGVRGNAPMPLACQPAPGKGFDKNVPAVARTESESCEDVESHSGKCEVRLERRSSRS